MDLIHETLLFLLCRMRFTPFGLEQLGPTWRFLPLWLARCKALVWKLLIVYFEVSKLIVYDAIVGSHMVSKWHCRVIPTKRQWVFLFSFQPISGLKLGKKHLMVCKS